MNRVLLTVLSGALIGLASFNSWAMNQSELETILETQPGFTRASAHNALEAFEATLKEESAAKRAVKLNDFGVYRPKQSVGMRNYRNPRTGDAVSKEAFTFVKKPTVTSEAEFIQKAAIKAGLTEDEMRTSLATYKQAVSTTLRKGGSVAINGEGTYGVGRVKTRNYKLPNGLTGRTPGHLVARYKPYGQNKKSFDFKPDDALNDKFK